MLLTVMSQNVRYGAHTEGRWYDGHYEGTKRWLSMFMFFLAGPQDATVATGTKVVLAGHDDATAHWLLTCRQASVVRRIGK